MSKRFEQGGSDGAWVKLCGIRDESTARRLVALRPDAIGLNFHAGSVRHVDRGTARSIARGLPESVLAVGVFVNETVESIVETVREVGLGAVQLHGDEPADFVQSLGEALPEALVLKAWRLGEAGLDPLADFLDQCARPPDAILIDAFVPGEFGGTGRTARWELLSDYRPEWPAMILAGGLHSGNVAAAIDQVRPFGVDTAGGVESAPGIKDPERAAAFVNAARSARRDSRL